jgi:type IV pilus assembly protein PilY1
VWQVKIVSSTYNVAPSTVTPYSDSTIYIWNHDYQFDVGTSWANHEKAENLYARIKVCDPNKGLEENCVARSDGASSYFKPVGLMQKNNDQMRFAAMGYVLESERSREGGVLRANMKYIGPKLPDGTDNPKREYDEDGFYNIDPDNTTAADSGVINYLNKFGRNGYKSKDPVGELYYECLNYFKGRDPTCEYSQNLDATMRDGFPVFAYDPEDQCQPSKSTWEDPMTSECQKNYIIGINDAFPHVDKRLPGTSFIDKDYDNDGNDDMTWEDYGEPSTPDPDINVTALTNTVGELQGINGTQWYVGCTPTDCDWVNDLKTIPGLGQVAGPRGGSKHNSWYIAGLAYYANSEDIRPDLDGRQSITTYMLDTQEYSSTPYKGEMNMLWLTGKYGGFTEKDFVDTNGDGNLYEPNLPEEWDADGDGEPDNYVLASDPDQLVGSLNRAFTDILRRASSGTAASVISSTRTGAGAVYQSIFHPYYNDGNCSPAQTREVSWVGEVHGLFVDPYGNMREDTNTNRTLNLVGVTANDRDHVVIFDGSNVYKLDDANGDGRLQAGEDWTDDNSDGELQIGEIDVSPVTAADLNYLWTTNDWLNELPNNNIPTQRPTYLSAAQNRYIFTFIDDGDQVAAADGSEEFAFTTTNITDIGPYLHLFDPFSYEANDPPPGIRTVDWGLFVTSQQNRVVNFVRGQDQGNLAVAGSVIPAMRSRQVDYDCDNTVETWRFGDVVHSTPTVVAAPAEDYDLIYRDTTYGTYYAKYRHRRHVVYVGGNDGMIHAFNGGFFDASLNKFWKTYDSVSGFSDSGTSPEVGAELWAYVPKNLLPHLYWLTDPSYSHVYYVDLKPKVFDARIFPADSTHTNGWGTVMVVGMRLGGSPIKTDKDHDGYYDSNTDVEMRSAYVIMDITNPESPPKVLAEITFDDLGFTTSYPAVIVMDPTDTTNANDWYLALGSGPSELTSATSDHAAAIYTIDLKELTDGSPTLKDQGGNSPTPFATLDANALVGDLSSVDFDLDYRTDVVYLGTSLKFTPNIEGKLRRLIINNDINPSNWDGSGGNTVLYDAQKPITGAPTVARDRDGRIWVYFGTGRFLIRDDISYTDQQYYFGIKEPVDGNKDFTWDKVNENALLDVSDIVVFEGGAVRCGAGLTDCANIPDQLGDGDDFNDLESEVDNKEGWKLDFAGSGERNLGQATLLGEILTFTTYTPSTDPCAFEGTSDLYALYYKTGTAFAESIIGFGDRDLAGKKEIKKQLSLGKGLTVTPNIHVGREAGSKAFIQTSTGAIEVVVQANPGETKSGKASWREE